MIAATLSGPSYFSPNHDERSIEVFDTLQDVIEALFDRYSANGQRAVGYATLDGKLHLMQFPNFGEGTHFICYQLDDVITSENYCADDFIEHILTQVHGGSWDWTVTLVSSGPDEELMVAVERAGI